MNDIPFAVGPGIAFRGDDHAHGGFVLAYREIEPRQFTDGGPPEQLEDITTEPRQDDLGFGVSETGIVFEHLRAVGSEHDADEQRAAKVDALGRDRLDRGNHDLTFDLSQQVGSDHVRGRVGSHAAGIGAGVAFTNAFVVLRGWQNEVVAPRDDHQNRRFFSVETVLDQHPRSAGAEFPALKHIAHGLLGLGVIGGNDDSFAGGETVRFDHDRRAAFSQVIDGRFDLVKYARRGGGDTVFEEDLFGEDFGGLEFTPVGFGAVGRDAGCGESVDQAQGERHFRSDDDKGDVLRFGESDQPGNIIGFDRVAGGAIVGHAGITRSGQDTRSGG